MIEVFLQGMVLGFGVAVPFGPVNILILTYALKSLKNSLAIGFGAMSADILYLFLMFFGILQFLNNEILKKILAAFGFLFLTYMAFSLLKNKTQALDLKQEKIQENCIKSFVKGFALNLFNPYVIAFWLSISLIFTQNTQPFFMVFGLFVAIVIWVCALASLVSHFAHIFKARVLFYINLISALIIEYFALVLLFKIYFEN